MNRSTSAAAVALVLAAIGVGVWSALPPATPTSVPAPAPPRPEPCPPDGPCPKPKPKPRPWDTMSGAPVGVNVSAPAYCGCGINPGCGPCRGSCTCLRSVQAKVGGRIAPDGKTELQVDLPGDLHQKNIAAKGLGCCVFRSIDHAARWANVPALMGFPEWMVQKGIEGGGYPSKVSKLIPQIAKDRKLPTPDYLQVEGMDLDVIRLACKTGRMVSVTYSRSPTGRYGGQTIAHMVNVVHADGQYFVVLDNNYVASGFGQENTYEWMTEAEFRKTYSPGWCVILLAPPPPPPPTSKVSQRRLNGSPVAATLLSPSTGENSNGECRVVLRDVRQEVRPDPSEDESAHRQEVEGCVLQQGLQVPLPKHDDREDQQVSRGGIRKQDGVQAGVLQIADRAGPVYLVCQPGGIRQATVRGMRTETNGVDEDAVRRTTSQGAVSLMRG